MTQYSCFEHTFNILSKTCRQGLAGFGGSLFLSPQDTLRTAACYATNPLPEDFPVLCRPIKNGTITSG
ncbi:MAG TPA: hypothetical protein VN381_12115, partial [Anaerovoracaceae bacterium]|nr:hypothetical protein [Anaerovoracaceae bacterium]